MTRFSRLLGLRRPVVQGPFGSGLSSVDLTVAVAEAGAVGSFGANHLDAEGITALVADLTSRTDGVVNVNLWVPLPGEADVRVDADEVAGFVAPLRPFYDALGVAVPDGPPPAAPRYDDQIVALLAAAPRVISFVFGVPDAEVVAEAHRRGVVVLATATTVEEAVVLDQAGVDVIVASGSDAGGHRGAFLRPVEESLVGTLSLVPQVVDAVAAPVVAAGGITDARQVRAAFALGAEGVQIGSGFLATHESAVPDVHKDALTTAPGRHCTVLTSAFSGRLARGVPNRVTRALADPAVPRAPYPAQSALTAPLRRAAAAAGDREHASLWSGQSAPLGRRTGAVDYLERLDADLAAAAP
ncbi:NAD(P)H-dependent flavin oxidoreductase [Micromonospora sp. NPDC049497]|uniref:NAD(P)H-dependent flavin oxidoreductase n=1 Tax=Micromonospora sp. NPDC049497 TaxID=3364273 RepID=UPI003792EC01